MTAHTNTSPVAASPVSLLNSLLLFPASRENLGVLLLLLQVLPGRAGAALTPVLIPLSTNCDDLAVCLVQSGAAMSLPWVS
jgi:hypothetical protein